MELQPELLHLVQAEAWRVARRLPPHAIPVEDLAAFGRLGLLEARDRWDPRRGVNFELYARHRIRGAIFDGLRQLGYFRRRAYDDLRRQALAHEALGEPPATPTSGPDRATDAESVAAAITDLATLFLTDAATVLHGHDPPDAETDLIDGEQRARLVRALDRLSAEDREVVTAVYDMDDTGDSGAALARRRGVTRSHVSRRHLAVLARLRAMLRPDEGAT